MPKTYVVDTNVLIQAPYGMFCFEENHVVLPLAVVEELDALKKADGERGANAREAIRNLEKLRLQGDLLEGVSLENGGTLRVEVNCINTVLPEELPEDRMDNRILKVCKALQDKGTEPVILVTKDLVLRIKACLTGITAEDFSAEQAPEQKEQYTGRCVCYVDEGLFKEFKKKGIPKEAAYQTDENGIRKHLELTENEFVLLYADQSLKKSHLGRVEGDRIIPLTYRKETPYGVTPRNCGQYFLQEALMLPAEKAPLVIVKGMAGTAKTFYSLAVGLERLLNHPNGEYRRILVSRPNAQFDSDIGYLPGDEQEKISPLMRPIIDNLEQLVDSDEKERFRDESELRGKLAEIFDRGIIQTEALNFVRGRSFIQTYFIVDEAQNMTPKQIKGIITRAGKGTKIILLGDPDQIDSPFLDEKTNGLSYASEYMKGSPLCYQVTLTAEECERSALANDAITRL